MSDEEERRREDGIDRKARRAFWAFGVVFVAGMLACVMFARSAASCADEPNCTTGAASITAVGWAVAGASLLIGGLIGALFGIPRRAQPDPTPPPTPGSQEGRVERRMLYTRNTNLEQISDWLTKILVGVGLTQLGELATGLGWIADTVAPGLGAGPASRPFAIAIALYFAIGGFMAIYLWTSLYLAKALSDAESVDELKQQIDELQVQAAKDATALALVAQQLRSDKPEPTKAALVAAMKAASPSTRAHAYFQARSKREETWRGQDAAQQGEMLRTIPIFAALADADETKTLHSNVGQLAYALKDRKPGEWERAEQLFTEAIKRRGDALENGIRSYEFNRALCRIQLTNAGISRSEEEIIADLAVATTAPTIKTWMESDQAVAAWVAKQDRAKRIEDARTRLETKET